MTQGDNCGNNTFEAMPNNQGLMTGIPKWTEIWRQTPQPVKCKAFSRYNVRSYLEDTHCSFFEELITCLLVGRSLQTFWGQKSLLSMLIATGFWKEDSKFVFPNIMLTGFYQSKKTARRTREKLKCARNGFIYF